MIRDGLFTSESVTEGHPDKMADQISDAVLDALFEQDPSSRVACETLVTTGLVVLAGEVTTKAHVNLQEIVRNVATDIGYTSSDYGFDSKGCAVLVSLDQQSADIAQGVDEGAGLFEEQGAGDQGLMFGYAINETPELMPMSIAYAHRLTETLARTRKDGTIPFLRPDGKSQVTVEYRDGQVARVDAVVISTQHHPEASHKDIVSAVRSHVIEPVIPAHLIDSNTKFFINPTGRFVVGGPHGDAGLTGRKIIVDTYGGHGGHGGGAFSGKDPSKVDRSAAYMARHIAKNVVAAGLASRCQIQLAYAIGVAEPVSVNVETYGTAKADEKAISAAIRRVFPLKPAGLINHLKLLRPIYRASAAYGHFGRELPTFEWESTAFAEALKAAV